MRLYFKKRTRKWYTKKRCMLCHPGVITLTACLNSSGQCTGRGSTALAHGTINIIFNTTLAYVTGHVRYLLRQAAVETSWNEHAPDDN